MLGLLLLEGSRGYGVSEPFNDEILVSVESSCRNADVRQVLSYASPDFLVIGGKRFYCLD